MPNNEDKTFCHFWRNSVCPFLPICYIVGRRQKRSWECGQSFFRRSLVLKAQKARVFKAFLAFGRVFHRSSVGIFRASFYLKMNTKKTPCKIQSVLLFLICFPIAIRPSSESKSFCTFGRSLGLSYNNKNKNPSFEGFLL